MVFATVTLALGMIWARYAWGSLWAWDMRLSAFLVLWLLYVGYAVLRRSADAGSTSVLAAVLAIFAFLAVLRIPAEADHDSWVIAITLPA
jgi:heme exporter protein C